jgi:hypothetical protein
MVGAAPTICQVEISRRAPSMTQSAVRTLWLQGWLEKLFLEYDSFLEEYFASEILGCNSSYFYLAGKSKMAKSGGR